MGVVLAAMAVGTILKGVGQVRANMDQAQAERNNAAFYREQAEFARQAGDRQRTIFDRESTVLLGDQTSAFARAGVDTGASSYFLAQQIMYRQEESYAIKKEADFNVRLATLRAEEAESTARALSDPTNNAMGVLGTGLQMFGSVL